ncbi:MAG: hypothetical protein WCX65_13455 [bacterium]
MKRTAFYSRFLTAAIVLTAAFFARPAGGQTAAVETPAADKPVLRFIDEDKNGSDSPGDELLYGNSLISMRFRFVDVSSAAKKVDAKFNGYYLDTVTYRGEICFKHPDWRTAASMYPTLKTNDVIGMTAFSAAGMYKDEPFLWMWNAREPARSIAKDMKWISPAYAKQAYEWYTLYDKHELRGGALVLISGKSRERREELSFSISGAELEIAYSVKNLLERRISLVGIITFPANRIIDTVFAQPDLKVSRKITPTAFSDNYTFTAGTKDGLAGSGMLFWSAGEASLLHMDGLYSWHKINVEKGETETRALSIKFLDTNIDKYYAEYLAEKNIKFDPIDWKATEEYLINKLPLIVMPEGYIHHAYDYNPPGTRHDWHNEMTGRAFMVKYFETGDKKWLDYTVKANRYYIDKMMFNDPKHRCYGYFKDQTYADKQRDCYLWSQPYNVESLIAEYAVTKDAAVKKALLLNFEKVYGGPLFDAPHHRWYWTQTGDGKIGDFGVFDAQEFGADVMISAYEFTGNRKYLDRAVEVIGGQKHALENFGLLLEDRAGEPSVNTFAFASKILFKLYEHTGNEYWLDRAIRILNATIYSRVYMEPFGPQDAWLNGALARKDGDWKGQMGEPTTGTDSSVPSQSSYIPWVMEPLVAGFSHTGNNLYIKYIAQMLHHQLEANSRMAAASGGKFELCGHYNMYLEKFDDDDDGLTVVSNLFLFPYVAAFQSGFRSPRSTVVLLPGKDRKSVRAFHLAGIEERVKVIAGTAKIVSVRTSEITGGKAGAAVKFDKSGTGVEFKAAPYKMYIITAK